MPRPIVAIVGAPNVGKSTLFNRLLGRRQAIVADEPGVTRDRLTAEAEIGARGVTLVDTGGVSAGDSDDLVRRVREESLKAAEMADVILFVIDGRAGVTAADEHVARLLRKSARRVVPVVNKIDSRSQEGFEFELYRLGFEEVLPLSAEEGRGLIELVERIEALLPEEQHEPEAPGVAMAIVGRPNVGKSSLFNRLLKDERSVVSDRPGTTRDPVDATFQSRETLYRVVDTAGIRRRITGADSLEWVSVLKARQALERASVAIGLVDATLGIEHQDRALLGLIIEVRKPAVLGVNKIDLVAGGPEGRRKRLDDLREGLRFATHIPVVPLSAKTGEGVGTLLGTLDRLREESARRFPTPELNRALESILAERQPPSDHGHAVRMHYISQAPGSPPRFVVFGNGRKIAADYRRFMEHRLRDRLGLAHAPITLLFRRRSR
ncbi:MAG TPA: ribosome biogenesis GTPase Der [Verrucomicrobiae bacterium]|nr:ribosome biogenesis GTPase Der [Verrucomicrobiae bacterium]